MHSSASNTQDSSDEVPGAQAYRTGTKPKFRYAAAPLRLSLCDGSTSASPSLSDTSSGGPGGSAGGGSGGKTKRRSRRRSDRRGLQLPPMGIYWDIENCQVPRNKSASAVVQRIREYFLDSYWEAEFTIVCDVKKEKPQVVAELHDAQVSLIHVASTSKNAADEKLRQSLRRFGEIYAAPSCVVLISSDINFASDLSDLRYRKKIRVILVHHLNVADALILCANEHHNFLSIIGELPEEKAGSQRGTGSDPANLIVSNLPRQSPTSKIAKRLQHLSNNCGGRVVEVMSEEGIAILKFSNLEIARRAQKRLQGEDVFGSKIRAVTPSLRNYSGRKVKNDTSFQALSNYQGAQFRGYLNQQDAKRTQHDLMGAQGSASPLMDLNLGAIRRPRTPKSLGEGLMSGGGGGGGGRTSESSEFSDDSSRHRSAQSVNHPVDLIISNLDPTITVKELRKLLTNMLKEYAMILSLNVMVQSDGTPVANIRVNNQQAAQFVISQLHRQKVGHKRIVISYANTSSPDPEQLKAMVISILQEVPDNQMPLFKFIELLESRFHCTIPVSEMNKLRDICKITDNFGSRVISFTKEIKASPPPNLNKTLVPYCTIHCGSGMPSLGWCELSTVQLPNVKMSLNIFESKLKGLLDMHLGSMPLLSFQVCYEQEYREPLPVDANGVPLEHLVTCVSNVEIHLSGLNKNIKIVKYEVRIVETDEEAILKSVPAPLAPNVTLLCRELVDLLKTTDRCQLQLSKFIPAYHHHFGRQCHVADYGFTKLVDLFEAIAHVVQIMGEGSRKIITLSHQAQMRRFTSDLLRVLKVQPSKQITVTDFPVAYEKVMARPFNPVDYGLCTFQDLLGEIPENIIVVSQSEDNVTIAVPKREQTAKEIMRTKQFAMEAIDLLRHSPYCTMLFNKFVPSYHHHFGHQCRVSDYGFSKLIELFEAIPDVVKIQELGDGERTVSLTLPQALRVLGAQITGLVKNSPSACILLDDLPGLYLKECGHPLRPEMYEFGSAAELVEKLGDYVQLIHTDTATPLLVTVDKDFLSALKVKVWALLLKPPYCKDYATFKYEFQSRYNSEFSHSHFQQVQEVVTASSVKDIIYVSLTALYKLAAELYQLLHSSGGNVLFAHLDRTYQQAFGKQLNLDEFAIRSLDELYDRFDFLFFVSSYKKGALALNRSLAEYQVALPSQIYNAIHAAKKWPPAPIHKAVQSTVKRVSPPKPDTPPTPASNPWHTLRQYSLDQSLDLNLSIQLPIIQNPQLLGDPYELISPARQLCAFNRNPWGKAPDPTELPMPDKLMITGNSDDSADSGVNIKLETSPPSDTEVELSGAKRRVATYLSFEN